MGIKEKLERIIDVGKLLFNLMDDVSHQIACDCARSLAAQGYDDVEVVFNILYRHNQRNVTAAVQLRHLNRRSREDVTATNDCVLNYLKDILPDNAELQITHSEKTGQAEPPSSDCLN